MVRDMCSEIKPPGFCPALPEGHLLFHQYLWARHSSEHLIKHSAPLNLIEVLAG